MREEDLGTYQMLWDCPSCDARGLLGLTHRHCPSCGAAQDPTTRYFPDESQKVAVADHLYTGVDWRCSACETPNGARADFCASCGAPKDNSKEVKRREDVVAGSGAAFAADSSATARKELRARPTAPPSVQEASKPRSGLPGWVLPTVGLVIALILVALFWKHDAFVEVSGHTWSRSIEVETYQPTDDSAWHDQVPSGAYDMRCSEEVRETRKVPDGETCKNRRVDKGDGTFSEVRECSPKYRDEPVYDSRCRYKIDRWEVTRTEKASGDALSDGPRWPEVTLARTGTCLGCEREGSRNESYSVIFKDTKQDGKTYACDFAQDRWSSMPVSTRFKSQAGVLTGKLDCSKLEPQ